EQLMAAVYPDDRACLERAVEEAAAAGTAYDLEHRVVRPDGDVRTVHSRGQIVADDTGRPLRRVGSLLDITERKRAELALARLAAIVESSDDAIISKDLDGVVVSWNPGAERLYGYAAGEVVGRPIAILVPPDRPDELPGIMARLGRGERITQFETVRLCKDGRRVEVSVSIAPIRDRAGAVVGASTIARDITAQKRAEEALRESEARFRMLADTRSEEHTS